VSVRAAERLFSSRRARALVRPLFALVLLLPLAAATPATEPYAFEASLDASPEVGVPVVLRVALEARGDIDAPLKLDLPAWVEVEEPREWHARAREGERVEREWRLVATRAGFWQAALVVDASRAPSYGGPVDPERAWQPVPGCCLFAWSTQERGIWGPRPQHAVPGESTVGFHTRLRALDEERAELIVRMSPQDARYAGQELVF